MAQVVIDIQLIPDLALPYEAEAEAWLEGELAEAWQALAVLFPDLHLYPSVTTLAPALLADMVDIVRMYGVEPPDPFAWFEMPCDEIVVDDVVDILRQLPFTRSAARRGDIALAGMIYGANPATHASFNDFELYHLRREYGVEPIYGWSVPGGRGTDIRIADVEHAWRTTHVDLIGASIERASTFNPPVIEQRNFDHGNGVLGILVAQNNQSGTIGIAPDARMQLVTLLRPPPSDNNARDAVFTAAAAARPGGIVLLELGAVRYPEYVRASGGQFPLETDHAVQDAITFATLFGITVIEPAGNIGENLNSIPAFSHVCPENQDVFVDSGAIMVGAGQLPSFDSPWTRSAHPSFDGLKTIGSAFGQRLDCFAQGSEIPTLSGDNDVDLVFRFGGTSGAGAIVAGVAGAVLGMANAAPGRPSLLPSDLRRMFRDPDLGKPIAKSEGIGGAMPSIRKIARHLGLARALPVAMVATGPHSFLMAQLDADDRLMLREWTAQNGWSAPLEATLDEPFELSPGTPAMTYWHETVAHDGMKVRIVMAGVRSTLREYWFWYPGWTGGPDSAHALKSAMSKPGTVCEGTDVAMVRLGNAATIAAIDCQGDLTVMMGQANPLANLTRPPIVVGRDFQGCVGPVMAVAGLPFQESIELVAIDQTGRLRWFRRPWANLPEWTAPTDLLPGAVPTVALDPAVKPALLAGPAELMVVAAGADGLLYACRISPLLEFVGELVPVDITVRIARQGPVALAMGSDGRPAAMAVGADGLLRIASFDYVTESWSDFDIVDPVTPVSPAGGVTAISLNGDLFIMAVLPNGQPCLTFQIPNIGGWFRLREVGQRELPIL